LIFSINRLAYGGHSILSTRLSSTGPTTARQADIHCHPMDYWIAGLMDCCKSKDLYNMKHMRKIKNAYLYFLLKIQYL